MPEAHGKVVGTFLALDQAPAIMGTLFILDLARHLFIRQNPRFILFIMPSLGPKLAYIQHTTH